MKVYSISAIVSVVLGMLAMAFFIHLSVSATIFAKVLYALFYIANLVSSILGNKANNEGKEAVNPLLLLFAQLALSFGILAVIY
jgi:uncharacterized Tic20 family protein